MRVVVLGASSFSTPHLARCLANRDDLGPITLVLAGRTPEHLAAVERASRFLVHGSPVTIETSISAGSTERVACLTGADIVVVQVRVGGYDARRYDETFPLEFDLCGDEGLGPGGLAAAWRTWPVLRGILNDVSHACPVANVLLLTSPVGLLVRLAYMEFPALHLAGICELPFTTLCAAARAVGRPWTGLDWQYLGVNHIGWIYAMRIVRSGVRQPLSPVALKYVRLQDAKAEVLAQQKAHPGARAMELAALAERVRQIYLHGSQEEIARALPARRADWYEEAVGPFIAAQAGGAAQAVFFLSVPQSAWRPEFERDDVLEIPHEVVRGGLMRRPNPVEPPADVLERVLALVRFERAAARAVMSHDRQALEYALSCHPWISGAVPAGILASRICATGLAQTSD